MKKSLLAIALIAALPVAAQAADGLDYNYAQANYVKANGDNNAKAEGWGLDGSIAVAPNWHLFAGTQQLDVKNARVDLQEWKIGAGYNRALTRNTDFVGRVAYQKLKSDDFYAGPLKLADGLDLDGYSVEAGVRSVLAPRFEGYAAAGYEKYGKQNGFTGNEGAYGRLGAQVKFNANWGIAGDVKFADGDTVWSVGPRISW